MITYKKSDSPWKQQKEKRTWIYDDETSETTNQNSKILNIKMPNEQWFNGHNYWNKQTEDSEIYESFKESKSWSGIWIEDSIGSSPTIFENIKINIQNEKQQLFLLDDSSESEESNTNENVKKTIKSNMDEISKSRGRWLDAENICKVGNKRKKDLQQYEIKNLRMFCSKPKNSLIEKLDLQTTKNN